MQTLLNHNNQPATIEVTTGYDSALKQEIKTRKTWKQLTDSDKQNIASEWIKDHVYCGVNQVMDLLSENPSHYDFEEYMSIAESQDYTSASEDHINDLSIDELIDIIEGYDLDGIDHIELFKTKYLKDLLENTKNTNLQKEDIYQELDNTFLQTNLDDIESYTLAQLEQKLLHFFTTVFGSGQTVDPLIENTSFDDLDTCITNLSINFYGYLKAYQSDLASLIISNIDLDEYGQNNNIDPEYDQAYEFYSVSDHFVAMTSNDLSCSNDILGLSVWARYCTGQSIALDHAVQLAAFKALSDCSYQYY